MKELAAALEAGAGARAAATEEVHRRTALIDERAIAAADARRGAYESWKAAQQIVTPTAQEVLADAAAFKGKMVTVTYSRLGSGYYDDELEINGELWSVAYDETVREALRANMKRLDDLHQQLVAAVSANHGVPPVWVAKAHYATEAELVVEIAGRRMHTPKQEVRDNQGRLVGTVDGIPFPIPHGVIPAVSSRLYVLMPGSDSSLEALDESGILP